MIITFDTDKPEDLAALVAIAKGAVAKESNLRLDMQYIMSIKDDKRRRALLANYAREAKQCTQRP